MKTLIISDLHLGNGGPYDVFEGGASLPALLDHLSSDPLRVIVNGDGVDFLMNDDPLELDPQRAKAQAQAIAKNPPSAAVFQAFGRVLARGGAVTIRLGNHDVELALPSVQAVFRDALEQPARIAERLAFAHGDVPEILEIGRARVLVTHGEHDDRWNKVDYDNIRKRDPRYAYAPGSVLVKKILNLGTSQHGMRFLSLLKPDFQGAALAALAVDPTVARQLLKGATMGMLVDLFRRKGMAPTFAEDERSPEEALFEEDGAKRLAAANLDEDELAAVSALLGEGGAVVDFAGDDEGIVTRAGIKIAKAALSLYAGVQRRLSGTEGDTYFALTPTEGEWTEARRLAKKYDAGAVIIGHTHAARWKEEEGLVYANTGTWIGLMQLPRSDESDEVWAAYLDELRRNKGLDPEKQERARILTRFTAVLAEPHSEGGAALSLVAWEAGELRTMGAAHVSKAPPK
jgi:UDP-2,3-diacylglucosamine pyrophosphatase LpxH